MTRTAGNEPPTSSRTTTGRTREFLGAAVLGLALAAGVLAADTPGRSAQDKAAGCPDCVQLLEQADPADLARDPHPGDCADCHHPHGERPPESWRRSCQDAACHPRAWTETIYHRLDAAVFRNCVNCHVPHEWAVEGADCLSCHQDLDTPAGTVPLTAFPEGGTFAHERHQDLECDTCHRVETRHADFTLTSSLECRTCHHEPDQKSPCSSCHGDEPVAGAFVHPVTAKLAAGRPAKTWSLDFAHDAHADISCDRCHTQSVEQSVRVDCASCHVEHHPVDAACASCHAVPEDTVHELSSHAGTCASSECHSSSALVMPTMNRNWCESCHREMQDHYPKNDCAWCHTPPPDTGP